MPSPIDEPVRLSAWQTQHPDHAAAMASQVYAATKYSVDEYSPGFQVRSTSALAGELMAGSAYNGFGSRIHSEPVNHFVTGIVYGGWATLRTRNRPDRKIGAGQVWRMADDEPVDVAYAASTSVGALGLPLSAIAEAAAQRADLESATVAFVDDEPTDAAAERYWALLIRTTYQQAVAPDPVLNHPLIRAQVIHALAEAALIVFPNTIMTAHYQPGPGRVGPRTLQRAVAYAHAHASRPLTLSHLADAAGTSPRALQKAFVQHYGYSPMAYLRRIRLEGAHQDLLTGDPGRGDRVGIIAARWGFAHLGRFGTSYREKYGVMPSQTLRG